MKQIDTLQKFSVAGITCGSCIKKIQTTLESCKSLNINNIKIDKENQVVSFKDDGKTVTPNDLNSLFHSLDITKYSFSEADIPQKENSADNESATYKKLYPLALVVSYLAIVVISIAWIQQDFSVMTIMSHYMGGFFLTFSFFKWLNPRGFTDAFRTYDPLAKVWRPYGYFYAGLELIFGIGYLAAPNSIVLNLVVLLVLSISSVGVIQSIHSGSKIQCACLGTIFNLPMTKVTVIENVSMILMAGLMIGQDI